MTLISDLIRSALRESNLIAASADPSTVELTEGVAVLNQFIPSLFGHEAGEEYFDNVVTTATDTARPNYRELIAYNGGNVTITLPATPDNGARVQIVDVVVSGSRTITVDPNGRKVTGAATLVLTAGSNTVLMYRADIGDWLRIAPLSSSDTLPFPADYEPLFIAAIAIRINGRNGQEVAPQLQAVFDRDIERIKFDYRQTGQADEPRTKALLNRALKIAGLVPANGQPRAAQLTDALRRVNAAVSSLFGEELGERLTDETFQCLADSGLSCVPVNTRLVGPISAPTTIELPGNPYNGSRFAVVGDFSGAALTVKANGRDIEGGSSVVLSADDTIREWFYRDDLASWVRLTPLTIDDDPPFPEAFDQLLEVMVAVRLSPDAISDTLMAASKRMVGQFRNRYRQTRQMPSELALLRLTGDEDLFNRYSNSTEFSRGEYFWRYFP